MATIYDVPTNELLDRTAQKLKAMPEMKAPEWAAYVKTGMHKARPPVNNDWWYVRAAAILRSVSKLGPIGVSKLRGKYGGKKNRGHKPERFYRGSGSIIRKCLQQLTKAGLLIDTEKNGRKGKIITPKGKSLLDKSAGELYKEIKPKQKRAVPKPAIKEEKKEIKKEEKAKEKPEKKAEVKKVKIVKEEKKEVKEKGKKPEKVK